MRATLNIPDELVKSVQKTTGEKSKTKAIIKAMEEFLHKKSRERLLALRGKVNVEYDWQKEERHELKAQRERERYHEK